MPGYGAVTGQWWRVSPPSWLQTDELLRQFGKQRKRAIENYVDFVRAGVRIPSVWQDLKMQIFLGDDAFVSELQAKISTEGDIREIPKAQHRPKAKPISHYVKEYNNPKEAMVAAYLSGGYTMKAIADEFGVHYATVSRTVNQYENSKNQR